MNIADGLASTSKHTPFVSGPKARVRGWKGEQGLMLSMAVCIEDLNCGQ